MKKDLISIQNIPRRYIGEIFHRTDELKKKKIQSLLLENKTLAMVFEKPSTRTRVSFETAMTQLGGHSIFLSKQDMQLGRGESIADTARTLSRYVDAIVARLHRHKDLLELAKHSSVPVINGLTDLLHPCQALSDMYTIDEKMGQLKGLKLAYVGDANNNICHSLMHACSKLGVNMGIGCPEVFMPRQEIIENAKGNCKITGTKFLITTDPKKAVEGADIIYTDTWISMGEEMEKAMRLKLLKPYRVNQELMDMAQPHCLFMHDLPAYRGNEVTKGVIDGARSIVWDQAENRLHVQKAILAILLGEEVYF